MKNSIIKLRCIDITVDFYGVCKYEGLVVFVKGMIPGEIANVKITKVKNRIAYGIIDSLIEKSTHRIKEPCKIAYKCGGCDVQHIGYDYQLVLKKKLIENTFRNMKLDINILDPIPSKDNYSYRNKIQVPVFENKVGYYRNHSNDIVEFDKCLINHDIDNDILMDIKSFIINNDISNQIRHIVIRNVTDGIMVCIVANTYDVTNIDILKNTLLSKYPSIKSILINLNNKRTNIIFGDDDKCIYGDEFVIDKCNDLVYKIPLRSFYQVNSNQMKELYDLIIKNGDLKKDDNVLDLFCGIGTISLYISKYVNKVLGIEIVDKSIEYANLNKEVNNINNVDFVLGDANSISDYSKDYNTVIVDPPRKGIDNKLVDTLINSQIDKIIYISCNQATLARDLKLLSNSFQMDAVQPVDMFPQTKHIESITVLKRK